MTEGWYGDDYLILFEETAPSLEHAYGVPTTLPGYRLLGLKGWDDFIVVDGAGALFTVPTVPLSPRHLEPFTMPNVAPEPDERIAGKIKWYIQPIVFGGDPSLGDNVIWVTVHEHAQLVHWWNDKYNEVTAGPDGPPAA